MLQAYPPVRWRMGRRPAAPRALCAVITLMASLMSAAPLAAADAGTLRRDTGWPNGLVVVLGDPALALDLGRDGAQLVLWFSSDPRAVKEVRERILAAGLQGIVTADICAPATIPLRGELANVVAVDIDALGAAAPADAELRRVLIPTGSIYRRRAGKWTDEKTPWRNGYGSWTHVDAQPTGNPVARDTLATVPVGIQWLGGKGSHGNSGTDPFIERDSLVADYTTTPKTFRPSTSAPAPEVAERMSLKQPPANLSSPLRVGRDAFNGLPRWTRMYLNQNLSSLAIGGGNAYFPVQPVNTWGKPLKEDRVAPIRAIDLRTGHERAVFADAPAWRIPLEKGKSQERIQVTCDRGRVYIAGARRVAGCDAATGKVLWSVNGEGSHMTLPTVSPDGKTLYCLDGDGEPVTLRFFGMRQIRALVAIDTASGAVRWRAAVTSNEASQMIALDDGVVVGRLSMHGWNVGHKDRDKPPTILGVDRFDAGGRKSWTTHRVPGKSTVMGDGQIGGGATNMLVKDGAVFVAEHYRTVRIDLATGEAQSFTHPNIGCQRMFGLADSIAYANLVLWTWPGGQVNPSWTYVGIAHPACGSGFSVANGRFYLRSINMCDCNFHLRTSQSFHCEPPPAPVDDAHRLTPGNRLPAPVTTPPAAAPAAHAESLIRAEWRLGYYGELHSHWSPVVVRPDDTLQGDVARQADISFTPRMHAQRLEARRGENIVWAQQLAGRPAGQPVVSGDAVIQASRDGHVYAFDAATGAPRWRFLAARTDQRLVNSGQVESVWPCVGAVAYQGAIAIVAGFTPEMDGGGIAWGLDPATGAVRWKVDLVTPLATAPASPAAPGRASARFVGYHTNGGGFPMQGVKVVDGRLCVGYRRTANFGSHGFPYWAWVVVDPSTDRSVDLCARWYGDRAAKARIPAASAPAQPQVRMRYFEYEDGSIGDSPTPPSQKK